MNGRIFHSFQNKIRELITDESRYLEGKLDDVNNLFQISNRTLFFD